MCTLPLWHCFKSQAKHALTAFSLPFHMFFVTNATQQANALRGAAFGGNAFHIHNSTTNRSWNESSVMRFDQTLKLNETWRKLARGPMRDDSADSSQEKHLVRPRPRPRRCSATCHRPRCVSTELNVPWQPSNSTAPDLHQLVHMAQVSSWSPAQIQTWSVVSGCWRKRAVQPGNQVVKT